MILIEYTYFSHGNIAEALKIFRSFKSSGKQDGKQSNYY